MSRQGYSPRQDVQIFPIENLIAFFLMRTVLSCRLTPYNNIGVENVPWFLPGAPRLPQRHRGSCVDPQPACLRRRYAGTNTRRRSWTSSSALWSIDMLGPLKLDFRPEAYAEPLTSRTPQCSATCGITAFHNSVGVGGPNAYDEALEFISAWSGFAGRNSDVFSLVGIASDLDHAKAKHKIAVIMGLQNAEQFRETKDVKDFYPTRPALRTVDLQQPESASAAARPSASTAASATTASKSSKR